MIKRFYRCGVVFFAGFAFSSCMSTNLQSVKRAPEFKPSDIHKVLVVSITSTPAIRFQVEDEFVREWKTRGVDAVSSGAAMPANISLGKAGIAPYAAAEKFDHVLVLRLLGRNPIDRDVEVKQIGAPKTPQKDADDDQKMSEYVAAVVASPQYSIDYEVASLQSSLFSVPGEQRLWSGVSQTLVTGDTRKSIRPFAKVILKNMYSGH